MTVKTKATTLSNRARKLPNTINEESDENQGNRKPLVQTHFVAWACKHFAQPVMKEPELEDIESPIHYEREWRYLRNTALRREAKEEQNRIGTSRIEMQVFNTRNPHTPAVLKFHPYDQQIAVAGKDSFGIWDWGTGAKLTYCQSRGSKGGSKITALEWINGHDVALLMAANDDGTIKIWRPSTAIFGKETNLVSAWHALSDLQGNARTNLLAGVVMSWEQWTQTVITSGDVRIIRLWDAERELKSVDVPTSADCSVSCIDSTFASTGYEHNKLIETRCSSPDNDTGLFMKSESNNIESIPSSQKVGLITAGFADGAIRLFDRRLSPQDAKIRTWREHSNWIIDVQLRGDKIISGSRSGELKIFDIRSNNSISTCQVMNGLNALTIHRNADTYACGPTHPTISIHNLAGQTLNIIRHYEGFMSHRISSINCLSYHPHRMALAAGTSDSTVTVYCIDQIRR